MQTERRLTKNFGGCASCVNVRLGVWSLAGSRHDFESFLVHDLRFLVRLFVGLDALLFCGGHNINPFWKIICGQGQCLIVPQIQAASTWAGAPTRTAPSGIKSAVFWTGAAIAQESSRTPFARCAGIG